MTKMIMEEGCALKKFSYLMVFYAFLVGIPLLLILYFNTRLPTLTSGDKIPNDIATRNYAVHFSPKEGVLNESFFILPKNEFSEDLCLLLGDMPSFELLVNGISVYQYKEDHYVKLLHNFHLGDFLPGDNLTSTICLRSDTFSATWEHVMLGTSENIAQIVQRISILFYFLNGILVSVIFCLLCLYFNKRSERYLLFMSLAAIASAILSEIQCNMFGLPIPLSLLETLKLPLALLPTVLFGLACIRIFDVDMGRFRILYTVRGCTIQFFIVLFTRLHLPSLYWPTLFASYLIAALPAICAYRHKQAYADVVLIGLALRQATRHYATLVTTGVVSVTELRFYYTFIVSDMLLLIPCLLTTYYRFALKFILAEKLTFQLKEINSNLDEQIVQRTNELMRETEKIKRLEDRKHSMMLNIFHDLRSPLHIALGNLEMLADQVGADNRSVQTMQRQLDFMQRLVQDIFLVSKLEENRISFQKEKVSIRPLCESIIQDHRDAAAKQNIQILLSGDATPACVDRIRTGQLLQNIIENALIYTPENGTISVSIAPAAANRISISITDTGCGIIPEDIPFVFDRYFTGTRRKRPQSTGLGLCIAQELARGMGGYIEVQSEKGRGSTFNVYLPEMTSPEEDILS